MLEFPLETLRKMENMHWKLSKVAPLKIHDFFLWMVTTAPGLGCKLNSW